MLAGGTDENPRSAIRREQVVAPAARRPHGTCRACSFLDELPGSSEGSPRGRSTVHFARHGKPPLGKAMGSPIRGSGQDTDSTHDR